MFNDFKIAVIIPVLNEEQGIAKVLSDIPRWVDQIIVADNGSSDQTVNVARQHKAEIAFAPQRGYGAACLAGIEILKPCDIVVFVDGDYSDYPDQMERLVRPIAEQQAQLVIGSRALGHCASGAMTLPQRVGNKLACSMIRRFWGQTYSDLGPFRAITRDTLSKIDMQDRAFGWTVEMQLKAILHQLKVIEVPVDYRARLTGRSKVSGTVKGVILAGTTIIGTILMTALRDRKHERKACPITKTPGRF
ncbi:Undecaprenyl-phosphate mannosyltransferase [Roseovarius albus]|uniref:Undecaprenyl-phosphate mannosyltransferase n=1 Tax=Roseovarius albus TaxID=1247867 RepID=A0A1X6Z0X9_9RHOB|nr:glycosyltransferase family 2 protein [Roseovarius albus]SLN37134.1 Undecaprenyl-phosphate mannosyltransferase [Roseovarius albus]